MDAMTIYTEGRSGSLTLRMCVAVPDSFSTYCTTQ